MKFQKTLLAVSLAAVAVAANAQTASPVSVTENLHNSNAKDVAGNSVYVGGTVAAPVHSQHAKETTTIDSDLTWLPLVQVHQKYIDLGTAPVGQNNPGNHVEYDVFKYKTLDGTTVYQFENTVTGKREGGTYTADVNTGALTKYTGSSEIDPNTLEKGGKVDGSTGVTTITGFENRQVNGEHVIYGYQGGTVVSAGTVSGNVIDDKNQPAEYIHGALDDTIVKDVTDVRYVQTGILANTGAGPAVDAAKNIYGVSARNNNNVVMMTGDGIALADLSNKGTLQTDGSILNSVRKVTDVSGNQKTKQYDSNGKTIVEYYNNDIDPATGKEKLESVFYELVTDANGSKSLARITDPNFKAPKPESDKTGVGVYEKGVYENSQVHNTVTNKNVTYSEKIETVEQEIARYGVVDANGNEVKAQDVRQTGEAQLQSQQSVVTGVIDVHNAANVYGMNVSRTVVLDGVLKTDSTRITADGLTTTGKVDAKEFFLDGKKIDFTDLSVGGGEGGEGGVVVGGVTAEQVDAKVEASAEATLTEAKTYTDTKVEGAIKNASTELTAAAVTAATEKVDGIVKESAEKTLASANAYTDGKFNQVNKRLDDVEKTANRGVAIALAAQQAVPNVQPGQVAVFGGVGHYEGETAVSLGAVTSFTDRVSASGAFGFSEGSTFGGRVGVSYLFGGK